MKKVSALMLSLALIFSLSLPVSASEPNVNTVDDALSQYTLTARLEDAASGFIDPTISSDVLDSISVSFSTNSLSTRSVSDTDKESSYAVKNLGLVSNGTENIGTLYALTASEKEISDETTKNGVDAWITLVWIDYLGTDNELVSVSGGWTPNGKTISDRDVTYGQSSSGSYSSITAHPSSNSYSYDDLGIRGLRLFAESEASISGASSTITVSVSPTIWD